MKLYNRLFLNCKIVFVLLRTYVRAAIVLQYLQYKKCGTVHMP